MRPARTAISSSLHSLGNNELFHAFPVWSSEKQGPPQPSHFPQHAATTLKASCAQTQRLHVVSKVTKIKKKTSLDTDAPALPMQITLPGKLKCRRQRQFPRDLNGCSSSMTSPNVLSQRPLLRRSDLSLCSVGKKQG